MEHKLHQHRRNNRQTKYALRWTRLRQTFKWLAQRNHQEQHACRHAQHRHLVVAVLQAVEVQCRHRVRRDHRVQRQDLVHLVRRRDRHAALTDHGVDALHRRELVRKRSCNACVAELDDVRVETGKVAEARSALAFVLFHVELHLVLLFLSDLVHGQRLHFLCRRPVPRRRDFGFGCNCLAVFGFDVFFDDLGLLLLAVEHCNADSCVFERSDVVSAVPAHWRAESELVDHPDDEVFLQRRRPSKHVDVQN